MEQDDVLLLMPKEPSFAFYYVPLALLFMGGDRCVGNFKLLS